MIEFVEQSDNCNIICPYCEYAFQAEAEDYHEEGTVFTCEECEKSFHYVTNISIDHTTTPDCELNGERHSFIDRFCQRCSKIKTKHE